MLMPHNLSSDANAVLTPGFMPHGRNTQLKVCFAGLLILKSRFECLQLEPSAALRSRVLRRGIPVMFVFGAVVRAGFIIADFI